ncbi:hypothetical protein LIER_17694 [Lithospermum erythrorhizon]|uniref:Uncharacterized protein n=1 Tax=Lithospermum erythrorhizon TaxID=34254 RepID=A0AAV3QB79_LITER
MDSEIFLRGIGNIYLQTSSDSGLSVYGTSGINELLILKAKQSERLRKWSSLENFTSGSTFIGESLSLFPTHQFRFKHLPSAEVKDLKGRWCE